MSSPKNELMIKVKRCIGVLAVFFFVCVQSSCFDSEISGSGDAKGGSKNKKSSKEYKDSEDDEDLDLDLEEITGRTKSKKSKSSENKNDDDQGDNQDNEDRELEGGDSDSENNDSDIFSDVDFASLIETEIKFDGSIVRAKKCSKDYSVPGSANLYLAGMANGVMIQYNSKNTIDRAPDQSPVLAVPEVKKCLKEGVSLSFQVYGEVSTDNGKNQSNADGVTTVAEHELKAYYGKSNIKAPFNSLLGVFLTDDSPEKSVPPAMLAFVSSVDRDYKILEPKIGQIFFIGDGKTSTGDYHKVTVPMGAGRLFLGVMDSLEWNNNTGNLVGSILVTN